MTHRQIRGIAVSIIIPVFNRWELTKACLESLAKHKPTVKCEVIVVDNASQDETSTCCVPLGQALFGQDFTYFRQPENKNFSGACNIGAHNARGDYLFFLNNDTVVTNGWLEPLLDIFQRHENVGAVGPLLLYPQLGILKDRVQHAGVTFNPILHVLHLYEGLPAAHKIVSRPRVGQAITAAAMLIPKLLFFAHDGFDEAYINGFEDVDLCARLCAHGYIMYVEPASKIYHLQSQTPGRHTCEEQNSALLFEKSIQFLQPDMHLQLQRDGLGIGLSEWLAIYPKMSDRLSQLLSRRYLHPGNEAHVETLLNAEPFWFEGYAWLGKQLGFQKKWKEAFSWLLIASKLKPDLDTVIPLLKAASKAGEEQAMGYCTAFINQQAFSVSFLTNLVEKISQWSCNFKIDSLTAQCKAWLDRKDNFRSRVLLPAIKELHSMGVLKQSIGNRCRVSYTCCVELQKDLQIKEEQRAKAQLKNFSSGPLFSILMPVYNPDLEHLNAALKSVQQQSYTNWQLCIADDASTNPDVGLLLKEYARQDNRIAVTFRKANGHICAASNSALELVQGEYTVLMDQDDMLPCHALLEVALAVQKKTDAMLMYSDEDKIDDFGNRSSVYYKPPFDPDMICSQNYFNHLGVYKTSLLREVGGFREGFEGSQDHDLLLRCLEKVELQQIVHIPHVLYHWRMHESSMSKNTESKPYAIDSGLRAVQEHFMRTGRNAVVEEYDSATFYKVKELLPPKLARLSLLVTTSELNDATQRWLEELVATTSYPDFELLLLYSGKTAHLNKDDKTKYVNVAESALHDLRPALNFATGEIIGHIQAGLLPYEPTWLEAIVANLSRPEVSVIGGRIFSERHIIENAGFGITKEGRVFPQFEGVYGKIDSGYYFQHGLIRNVFMCSQESFFAKKIDFMRYYCEGLEKLWPAEFCMQAREHGLRVLCIPDADLYRQQGFPYKNQHEYKEHLVNLFSQKWSSKLMEHALHPMLTPTYGGYGINFSSLL